MSSRIERVLYVLYRYPQLSQTFVRDEIHALRDAGFTVRVISLDDPGPDAPSADWAGSYDIVPRPPVSESTRNLAWWLLHHPRRTARFLNVVAREPGRRGYALRRIPSLARRLAPERWPHVHSHFAWNTSTVAAALGILIAAPTTLTVHAKDIYAQPAGTVRRRLSLMRGLVTVCHFNVGYLTALHALPHGVQPRVICCGVSVPAITSQAPSVTHDIVTVGRLVSKKGVDRLLTAVAALKPELLPTVSVVGDGPQRQNLEALTIQLELVDQVTFTGGLTHDDALAAIASARVFCLASQPATDADSDAMPVVIREAMAHGVPVIASRLAGIPESVDEDVGWLVDPGSDDSLAAALRAALSDPAAASARGIAGRSRASERWSFSRQAGELRDFFDAVGDVPPRRGVSELATDPS